MKTHEQVPVLTSDGLIRVRVGSCWLRPIEKQERLGVLGEADGVITELAAEREVELGKAQLVSGPRGTLLHHSG